MARFDLVMAENKSSSISKAESDDKIGEFWDMHDFTEFDSDIPDAEFEIISTVPIPSSGTRVREADD